MGNHRIIGFVALKAKCYALLLDPDPLQLKYEKEKKIKHGFEISKTTGLGRVIKCKGVARTAAETLEFFQYYKVLKSEGTIFKEYEKLSSHNHIVHKINQRKMALNALDDKRFVKSCGLCTIALQSRYISSLNMQCNCGGLG